MSNSIIPRIVLDVHSPMTERLADLLRSFSLVWSVEGPTSVDCTSAIAIENIVTNITNCMVSVINAAISDHYGQQFSSMLTNHYGIQSQSKQAEARGLQTLRI